MSTSVSEQIRYAASSLYGNADDPVDSVLARRIVANNLMHACDSMGQARVNFWPSKAFGGNLNPYATMETPDEANRWHLFGACPMGPWPLTMRADGTPYRLVIRVAGAVGNGAGSATMRIILAPSYASALEGLTESTNRVFEITGMTSTTVARLSGVTQGDGPSTTHIDIDADTAVSWVREVPAFDAVSGGSPVTIQQCLVSAWVFGKTNNVLTIPRLYGLHLHEYIAP